MSRRARGSAAPAILSAADQMACQVTRASVSARTSRAPHPTSTCAQASSVAPVVATSSISTRTRSETRAAVRDRQRRVHPESANAPSTFLRRAAASRAACDRVARARRSTRQTGRPVTRPTAIARSSAWLKPRRQCRHACNGTGTSASAASTSSSAGAGSRPASATASDRRPSVLERVNHVAQDPLVGAQRRRTRDRRGRGRARRVPVRRRQRRPAAQARRWLDEMKVAPATGTRRRQRGIEDGAARHAGRRQQRGDGDVDQRAHGRRAPVER